MEALLGSIPFTPHEALLGILCILAGYISIKVTKFVTVVNVRLDGITKDFGTYTKKCDIEHHDTQVSIMELRKDVSARDKVLHEKIQHVQSQVDKIEGHLSK